jgi:hypothetical protein
MEATVSMEKMAPMKRSGTTRRRSAEPFPDAPMDMGEEDMGEGREQPRRRSS